MTIDEKTRIAVLETNQQNIMDKLEEFQSDNKEQHNAIMGAVKEMGDKLDKALEKKADVWVEKAMTYTLYTAGGLIITALMYLVIK